MPHSSVVGWGLDRGLVEPWTGGRSFDIGAGSCGPQLSFVTIPMAAVQGYGAHMSPHKPC